MVAEDFNTVLKGKYPGKSHAKRIVELLQAKIPDASGLFYLEGKVEQNLEDNDSAEPFRQRRHFYYVTGCNLPNCHFVYDIRASKSILFIPPINEDHVVWEGLPISKDEALQLFDVDEVKFTSELKDTLADFASPESTVFFIKDRVSDQSVFDGFGTKNDSALNPIIDTARVVKDEFEVAMIRKANHISGIAHKTVFQKAKAAKTESELEAAFLATCVARDAKEMAYHPIVASGTAAATLHYVKNYEPLEGKLNLLLDAGAEWDNYAADITRTFPISGKFTKESREIYDIVLKMQKTCIDMLKAGVQWEDVHIAAHKIAIDGLLSLGVLTGDKEKILEARTSVAFFPHGLGHYLGMDTHDTGGNANYSDSDKIFKYLRVRGNLPAGCVITVEPGIYFCEFIIRPHLEDPKHSKYINEEVLKKYWKVGGVRIEDNILVTESGHENLTDVEKEPEKLEEIISGH
ncbi:Fc.00g106570.m01.CDS01 [Cosmosporella sp. VM-42]